MHSIKRILPILPPADSSIGPDDDPTVSDLLMLDNPALEEMSLMSFQLLSCQHCFPRQIIQNIVPIVRSRCSFNHDRISIVSLKIHKDDKVNVWSGYQILLDLESTNLGLFGLNQFCNQLYFQRTIATETLVTFIITIRLYPSLVVPIRARLNI